jgi:lysozyme
MKTSSDGKAVMHYFEQCRLEAYPDPATGGDPWTIGWGDTGPDVAPGLRITQDEADERFARRLAREFEPAVAKALRSPTQAQFDAGVCLAYNIGAEAFAGSSVVRKHNAGDTHGAADSFLLWNRAGGRVMLGLRRRRAAERALYLGATAAEAIAHAQGIR